MGTPPSPRPSASRPARNWSRVATVVVILHAAVAGLLLVPGGGLDAFGFYLALYLPFLVPPLLAVTGSAPGDRNHAGGLGIVALQAILGIAPLLSGIPLEGLARGFCELAATAAVIGIGSLTLLFQFVGWVRRPGSRGRRG